jgi:hypothetical protein
VRVAGVGYVTRESLASERTVAVVNGSWTMYIVGTRNVATASEEELRIIKVWYSEFKNVQIVIVL